MSTPFWPLFDLRLATPRLVLRPCGEADLDELATIRPLDVETDPSLPHLGTTDPDLDHGTKLFQDYWRAMGNWALEHWRLNFVVLLANRPIGMQELEADDFAERRVVESSSWLVPEVRGERYGQEMRAAVLSLAFADLGAVEAETEAWHDNRASLGVSEALGYEPDGESLRERGDGHDRMVRMRLTRERWLARAPEFPVTVSGLDDCRHLLVHGGGGAGRNPPGGALSSAP